MQFCQQLSAYLSTKEYTGYQLYLDMYEQAILCDECGYDSVALTEHHLINILMISIVYFDLIWILHSHLPFPLCISFVPIVQNDQKYNDNKTK